MKKPKNTEMSTLQEITYMLKSFTVLDQFENPVATLPYLWFEDYGEVIIAVAIDLSYQPNKISLQFDQEDLSNYRSRPCGTLRDQSYTKYFTFLSVLEKAGWDFVKYPNPYILRLEPKINLKGFRTYSKN